MDAGAVQDHGWFRVVNEKIEKAQRLRVCLQRRKCLGLAGLLSFVGGEEINPQPALGGVAGHASAIDDVRNGAESLVDFLQNIEHRRRAIADRNRYIFELCDIDVAGLQGSSREPDTQHRGIGLIGDCADENAAKPEDAGLGERGDDIADFGNRPGKTE